MELGTHAKQAIRRYISLVGTLQKQMGRLGVRSVAERTRAQTALIPGRCND